jgi:hypothetical protein
MDVLGDVIPLASKGVVSSEFRFGEFRSWIWIEVLGYRYWFVEMMMMFCVSARRVVKSEVVTEYRSMGAMLVFEDSSFKLVPSCWLADNPDPWEDQLTQKQRSGRTRASNMFL